MTWIADAACESFSVFFETEVTSISMSCSTLSRLSSLEDGIVSVACADARLVQSRQ